VRVARRPLNPVLARELRQRMRGKRAAVVISLYLLLLSAIMQLVYSGLSRSSGPFGVPSAEAVAGIGKTIFQTLLFFVLLLVCFIVPGVSAGAVAGERERQTLVPLQVTLLRPRSILVGKMLASLAFVSLLVVATLPLAGVSFLLGGVEPVEAVKATAMVLVVAAALGCLSLLCSTLMRGTQGATVVSYGLVLALVLGTFFVFGAQLLLSRRGPAGRSQLVLAANPFMAVAGVLDPRDDLFGDSGASPFTPLQLLLQERDKRTQDEAGEEAVPPPATFVVPGEGGVQFEPGVPPPPVQIGPEPDHGEVRPFRERRDPAPLARVPFWALSLVSYVALGVGSLALASRRLALPKASL
jgi:ABC-2 type transport system permease protein